MPTCVRTRPSTSQRSRTPSRTRASSATDSAAPASIAQVRALRRVAVPTKSTKGKGKPPEAPRTVRAGRSNPAGVEKADDSQTRGDRSKRLLDLVMILLRARTPVTYREIREQFPGYQTLNVE